MRRVSANAEPLLLLTLTESQRSCRVQPQLCCGRRVLPALSKQIESQAKALCAWPRQGATHETAMTDTSDRLVNINGGNKANGFKPVALVSMPTLSGRFPSFQLALLKPTLE